MAADGVRRAACFVTSAYSSYSGCRQYREDLAAALLETGLDGELNVDKIRVYFDHPGFIEPTAEHVAAALDEPARTGFPVEDTRVFFTTHSIPLTMAASSGPPGQFDDNGAYVAQHLAAIGRIVEGAEVRGAQMPQWQLVDQSRSGSPHIPWLEPDINVALRAAAAAGAKAAVIVPVGFISDHVEVVWDLDHEARETCNELGMDMIRVATPGTHPAFVSGIADLVEERLGLRPPVAMSSLGPWPDRCAADCCANSRVDLPTVAGADA
jgi:ferrochelatase